MRSGRDGIVINIGRGSVIDEQALIEALTEQAHPGRRARRVRERAACAGRTDRARSMPCCCRMSARPRSIRATRWASAWSTISSPGRRASRRSARSPRRRSALDEALPTEASPVLSPCILRRSGIGGMSQAVDAAARRLRASPPSSSPSRPPRAHLVRRACRAYRLFHATISSAGAAGSARPRSPISSRSASSCRGRARARSAWASATSSAASPARSPPLSASRCHRRSSRRRSASVLGKATAIDPGLVAGLAIVAVAVVAEAVRGVAASLASSRRTGAVAIAAAALALAFPGSFMQIAIIAAAARRRVWRVPLAIAAGSPHAGHRLPTPGARGAGIVRARFFVGLPLSAASSRLSLRRRSQIGFSIARSAGVRLAAMSCCRCSSPSVVSGRASCRDRFRRRLWRGAGDARGPLFSIAAHLGGGALMPALRPARRVRRWRCSRRASCSSIGAAAVLATAAAASPSVLRGALVGVNAAVVRLLAAALYHPVFVTAGPCCRRDPGAGRSLPGLKLTLGRRWPAWSVVALLGARRR